MKFSKKIEIGLLKLIIKTEFIAPNIIIAGGVGSFEPRKISLKEAEKLEGNQYFMQSKIKKNLKIKKFLFLEEEIQPLDWALELSKFSKITLIHRRNEFRGAPTYSFKN